MSASKNPSSSQWNIQQNNAAIGGAFRSGFLSTISSNPTMTRTTTPPGQTGGALVVFGEIIRVAAGAYDCMIRVGNRMLGCSFADTMVSHTFGYSFAALPVEGSYAVAVIPEYESTKGIVIAIIPYGVWAKDNEPKKMLSQRLDPYEPHGYTNVSAYKTPIEDPKYELKLNSSSNRPIDIIPGEFAILNEHRAGLRLGAFSSEIRGGGAYVRAERVDDEIRVGGLSFTMWMALDCFRSFNDIGYISGESKESSYQGERLGYEGLKLPSEEQAGSECNPRVKEFRGYLGGQRGMFVLRPQTPSKPEEGVAMTHVSESGKMLTRSASGMSFELYDKIPVPKRVMEYWDPEGNKDDAKHEAKTPFDYGSKSPHTDAMQLYDSIAWNQRNDYLHLDGYDKDFVTPEEQEIPNPEDPDRDPHNSKDSLTKNKKRRAGLHVMPDGSVVIRDAWGSELVLSGGNVYINTCGNVISMAHKDNILLSGENTILRSRNGSVTADSSKGVVELHGTKHVTIVGGKDGSSSGGVLIEGLGSGGGTESDKKKGHNSVVNGVVIKSAKSDFAVEARGVKMIGERDIRMLSGKEGKKRTGRIIMSTSDVMMATENSLSAVSSGSFFYVGKSGFSCVTKHGSSMLSESSVTIVQKKNKLAVPQWVKVKGIDSTISRILDTSDRSNDALQDDKIMSPYDFKRFQEKILAVVGTSSDYGTNNGIEPYNRAPQFTLYEPSWEWLKKMYPELITISPETWDDSQVKINGSNPWPGEDAWNKGKFVVLPDNPNLSGGYSKKRKSLVDSCDVEEKPISEFKL